MKLTFKTIDQADVAGKRVLVRADLNVPIKDGKVTDATRLERFLPTLRGLIAKRAKVVVLSHFDRPKGKRVPSMSLKPIAAELSRLLGQDVAFADDCIGPAAEQAVKALASGQVLVLENLRYHAGEEENDPAFVKQLACLGDIYVNDGFSVAHRAHASTEGIAHILPAYAGRQMQAELEALGAALVSPRPPVAAIIGGSKVSTKLDLLNNLVEKVNILVIGGGMANTFLYAQGIQVGKSLCEKDLADTARQVLAKATASNCEIILPHDVVTADALKENAPTMEIPVGQVPDDQMILDVGPATIIALEVRLSRCKTVLWNGPLGAFEIKPFDTGTNQIARLVGNLTKSGQLISVAGGGDTVAALNGAGATDMFTYVSTAGGAFLEWLEGKELPGVKALG